MVAELEFTYGLPKLNRRQHTIIITLLTAAILLAIIVGGLALGQIRITTNLASRYLAPGWSHPFGTDWLGRDISER